MNTITTNCSNEKATSKTNLMARVVWIAIALIMASGCQEDEEVQEVDQLLDDLAGAFEDRNIKGMLALTSRDFTTLPGHLSRSAAARRLHLMFRLNGALELLHPRLNITIHSAESATVSGPLVIVRPGGRYVPALEELYDNPGEWLEQTRSHGQVVTFELSLIKPHDRWLVQTARFYRD